MKEFPQATIDQTRSYFEGQKIATEAVTIDGKAIPYFVIPQQLNPKLPDFALRMTNTTPETKEVAGIFGVSDSVPTHLRPYWAMHEIIEFTQIGIEVKGRCAEAERKVVSTLPQELREEYVKRRRTFFTNLCDFFREDLGANTGNYTEEDLHEAEASLAFIESLQ